MIVTPTEARTVHRYISCPTCGKGRYEVGHLPIGTRTVWDCDEDSCGYGFALEILPNTNVNVEMRAQRRIPTVITLRVDRPFTVQISGNRWESPEDGNDDLAEYDRYYYEEHTCPTNFLGVEAVIDDDGDDDPHGLFRYISTAVGIKQ